MVQETSESTQKINEALDLLREAARDKKEELQDLISDKYSDLRGVLATKQQDISEILAETKTKASEFISHARETGQAKAKEIATTLDENIHSRPWKYAGWIGVSSLIVGYMLGKKHLTKCE